MAGILSLEVDDRLSSACYLGFIRGTKSGDN